jgi:hypothetical protein
MNKASCLSLLSNAVLVWNTVHMSRIAEQLRAAGHALPSGSYFQSPHRRADISPEAFMA